MLLNYSCHSDVIRRLASRSRRRLKNPPAGGSSKTNQNMAIVYPLLYLELLVFTIIIAITIVFQPPKGVKGPLIHPALEEDRQNKSEIFLLALTFLLNDFNHKTTKSSSRAGLTYANQANIIISSGVEKLVSRWAHNPKIAGSNPAPATA